jgi:hypothetical protein
VNPPGGVRRRRPRRRAGDGVRVSSCCGLLTGAFDESPSERAPVVRIHRSAVAADRKTTVDGSGTALGLVFSVAHGYRRGAR